MAFTSHNRVIMGQLVHSYANALTVDAADTATPLNPPFVRGEMNGKRRRTNLIFLHGWRSEALVWLALMEKLAKRRYNCFAPDLPGFGKSPAPRRTFSLSDYCALVEEYISICGAHQPITLICHSFGGRIGIKLAAQNKPPFARLVLIDSAGIPPHQNGYKTRAIKTLAHGFKFLFKPRAMQPLRNRIYHALGAEDYIATPKLKQIFLNAIKENLTPLLSQIRIPTLILWGERDKETAIHDASLIHERIPHSKLIVFKNARHFSFLDEPEKTASAIAAFAQLP